MPRTPALLMICKLVRHAVGRADERIAADGVRGEISALGVVLLRRNGLRRDVLVRQHSVDRAPVGILDDGVAVIVLRLLLGRAADHLADRIDLDLAADAARSVLDLRDLLGIGLKRSARARASPQKMHRSCAMQRLGRAARSRHS